MTNDEYLALSKTTDLPFNIGLRLNVAHIDALDGAMGLLTEAGHHLDVIKKHLMYGKESEETRIFQEAAGTWEVQLTVEQSHVLHSLLGISTETAELVGKLFSSIRKNEPFDLQNLKEELGDLFWYIAQLQRRFGISYSEIQSANIAKLKKRYPNGFNRDDAIDRDIGAENHAMHGAVNY